MAGNQIGVEGTIIMSEMMKVNATLTSLNLSCEEEWGKRKIRTRNEKMID